MKVFLELEGRQKLAVLLILILIFSMWAFDAIDDLSHGANWVHIAVEAAILFMAALWIISICVRYFLSKGQNIKMRSDLVNIKQDLDTYKRETAHLAHGLGLKIDQQLDSWDMTKAEKEVALLLLKGLSNKEIANIRNTSEKTTIQQVSKIYEKSGIHNRAEFSAFFLEDLLLPPQ